MARPRTPIGTHGVISIAEMGPGLYRARTRYRFEDGRLRQIERFAPSRAKAKNALQRALAELDAQTPGTVHKRMNLSDLADRFIASKSHLAPRSQDTYRQTVEHLIRPRLGALAVSEATPERLQNAVDSVRLDNGPGAAKAMRAVLSGMMGLAARSDAIRSNPVRELAPITRINKGATAIPLAQLPQLLQKISNDSRLHELDQVDLLHFLAATGCRVGEACALAWTEVDLDAGTVTINFNVLRARGRGVIRQDHPKTKAGVRTIAVPDVTAAMLTRRRAGSPSGTLVFPTIFGNLRDPRNTSRDWALARGRLGYPEVTTHSFRKTVATLLDQAGLSAREIAEFLGHKNPSITQDVYMSKNTGGMRAATALAAALKHSS